MSGSEKTRAWGASGYEVAFASALGDAVAADLDALAEKIDVQANITGQLGASFHALAARVAALEAQPRIVTAGSQDDDRVSPAPPAPLVERMAGVLAEHCGNVPGFIPDPFRPMARVALRVAAEKLLAEITLDELEDACTRYGSNTLGATTNGVLRSRLAAALEACR